MNAPLIQRSILSASSLAEQVLPHYDLPDSPVCEFWNHSINDTYLIKAGGSKFVLRVSPTNWRLVEQIEAEAALLRFLNQHDLSVPQPIPQRDGKYVQALNAPEGIRYAVLFTLVPGAPAESMNEEISRRYGQAIAKFHSLTDDYPTDCAGFRFDPTDIVEEPLARIKPLFAEHQDDYDYLFEIATDLKRTCDQLPRLAPEHGICHGDVNASNFHFENRNGCSLIDFEYFGYGWRIFDIATFINNQFVEHGMTEDSRGSVDSFLEGYQAERRLSEAEIEALPSFVIMRQIWLLGISAKYIPKSTIGSDMHRRWIFEQVMPFIRSWMREGWK